MSAKTFRIDACSALAPYELPTCKFTRKGYQFKGWRLSGCCFATSDLMQPGEELSVESYVELGEPDTYKLYLDAEWKVDPTWPTSYRTSFSASDLHVTERGDEYYNPVVMDPGGASGSQRLYEGLTVGYYPAPSCPYSRTGYRFAGWALYSCCIAGFEPFY